MQDQKIVFFDGVCGLCDHWVQFLLDIDGGKILKYAPLQGEKAKEIVPKSFTGNMTSIVFFSNGKFYTKSSAVLKILSNLGGIWKMMSIFVIIPPFIRDFIYDLIAKNRYRFFGKLETCRILNSETRHLFFD